MQVIIDNHLVSYVEKNSDAVKSVLFLHGWGSNKETFDQLMASLSKDYRVIALDYPGFGQSQAPSDAWGIPEYAEFILTFLGKLECNPDVIVGHSMGGRIVVYLAGSGHLQDAKLILLGAAGFKESSKLKNQAFKAIAKGGKLATKPLSSRMQDKLKNKLYGAAGASDYLDSGAMKETFSKVIDLDLSDHASKITNQSLLVYGENDDQTPPEYGKRYNQLMTNSTLHILPEAGHYVYHDAPDQTIKLMQEFMA